MCSPAKSTAELARFENARRRSITDLRALQEKVQVQVGKEAAAIFAVHETILQDVALLNKVRAFIQTETPRRASRTRQNDGVLSHANVAIQRRLHARTSC